jgi:cytochrome c556
MTRPTGRLHGDLLTLIVACFEEEQLMMIRSVVAVLAIAFGVTAVVAQAASPIAARKAMMKENNDHARTLSFMARGRQPFDAAKVNTAFDQWADTAQKFGALFPDNSKTGGETKAAPKIWQTKSDFEAKLASFGKVVADNKAKAVTLDGLKAALPAVIRSCDACHDSSRLPD